MRSIFKLLYIIFVFAILAITPNLLTAQQDTRILLVKDADADNAESMKVYAEVIEHTELRLEMLPIPGGEFTMGSPEAEPERKTDEGPQHAVQVDPFWMSKCEVTWDLYDTYGEGSDKLRREIFGTAENARDKFADVVTKPTTPYTDMSFKMGKGNKPAICMTQHAARKFCEWLSAKPGDTIACRPKPSGSTRAAQARNQPGILATTLHIGRLRVVSREL